MCRRKHRVNFHLQEFIILISLICIQVAVSVMTNMINAHQDTITGDVRMTSFVDNNNNEDILLLYQHYKS